MADIGTKILPANRMKYLKTLLMVKTLEQTKVEEQGRAMAVSVGPVRRYLLSLLGATLPAEVASRTVSNVLEDGCDCIWSKFHWIAFFVCLFLAFLLGWQLRSRDKHLKHIDAQQQTMAIESRTVQSQAPVTFARWRAQPRFYPLPEDAHG